MHHIGDIGACFIVTHTIVFAKILAYQGIFNKIVVFFTTDLQRVNIHLDLESLGSVLFNFVWV